MPAAIGAMFDVHGVVEIARGLAIDGDDWQVAEIFAAGALGFTHGLRAALCLVQSFGGEGMRKTMLADDDFSVDAKIAGAAKDLNDAAGRRSATLRITEQLHVYDGAVQFFQPRDAPHSNAGFIRAAEAQFLPQARREFLAARNLDLVLNSNVVRQDHIVLRAVAKQSHHRGVRAVEDSNDTAFRSLRSGDPAQPLNLRQNMIAVHGVLDGVARDENIAVELRHRRIRDHEAIAVVVEN